MEKSSVLTIGNFDGVHVGHKKIISQVVENAKKQKVDSVLLTFEPHPIMVLSPSKNLGRLSTLDQKKKMVEALGINDFVLIAFDRDMANISSREFFLNHILKPHQPIEIHVGYDFAFGMNREGNQEVLQKLCDEFKVKLVVHGPYKVENSGEIISSSKIRESLLRGDVKHAYHLLGYYYKVSNNVVKGDGRGKTIGFPTANLARPENLIPEIGVYASLSLVKGKKYFSVTNVGRAPTFKIDGELKVESHFLNFDSDIYGESVEIEFIEHIRSEKKFDSVNDLITQIKEDIGTTKTILAKI